MEGLEGFLDNIKLFLFYQIKMDLSGVSIEELQRLLDERVAKAKEEELLAEQKAKEEEEQKAKEEEKQEEEEKKTWDMLKRKHEEEMQEDSVRQQQQMDLGDRQVHYQTEHYLFEKKGKQVHLKLDKIYDDEIPEEVRPKDELVYQSVSVDGKIVDVRIKDKIICEAERLKKGGMIWIV
jgi:membrane-bound lytic murein transglycosylase